MAKTKLRSCIFCLLAVCYVLSDHRFVGGRRIGTMESKRLFRHKGTVKTIEGKDGDVIDCVDIYQQPAFDHPFLKNHTIQMKPSSINPNVTNEEFYDAELFQGLHENEEYCPEGTIPIRHAREDEYYANRAIPPAARRKNLNIRVNYDTNGHEYAGASVSGGNYLGARAFLNVWNPATNDGDISIAQVGLRSGPSDLLNTIEAGWMVNSRDNEPKLFIYWTRDGYKTTGCYNLDCAGFVQVNRIFALGSPLKPVSSYNAKQYTIRISIYKNNGNWWLQVKDQVLGYWPSSIFTDLATSASTVSWDGEIYDSGQQAHHTTTQMGSGHFPSEGFGKATYFRNIQYMDDNGKFNDVETGLEPYATKSECYDIRVAVHKIRGFGTHLYFGGPGYSATCP